MTSVDRQVEELIQKHLDGRASAAELADLDRLLVQSPLVADALWKAAEVDALLGMHWQANAWRAAGDRQLGVGDWGLGISGSRLERSAPTPSSRSQSPISSPQTPISNPQSRIPEPFPPRPATRRRLAAVGLAAALVFVALTAWWRWEAAAGHRVMAGTVEVHGLPVTRIIENDALRVVGNQTAVIRLSGGSQAELEPFTSAVVRGPNGSALQTIELLEGGGRFRVPRAARRLCVETANGSLTAADTDFQVNLWSTQGKGDDEMRFRSLFVLAVAVSTGMVEVNSPDEECVLSAGTRAVFGAEAPAGGKVKDLGSWLPPGDALGFKQKDRPFALEQLLPGANGAIRVSDEQKKQLATAIEETIDRREVRAAMAAAKLNPNATEAQKLEARRLVEQARTELKNRVARILTPAQTTLVEKINAAVAEAQQQTREAMQDDLLAIKSDSSRKDKVMKEYQQRVRSAMESRVLALLDADAQAAFKKAAAAQAASAKPPKKGPKPAK